MGVDTHGRRAGIWSVPWLGVLWVRGIEERSGWKTIYAEKNVNHFTKIRLVLFLIEDIFSVDQIFQGHS